jgi:hypothetical protein
MKTSIRNYFDPILNILVAQVGQVAFIAGLPLAIVTCSGLSTSFLALHFTQYIDVIVFHLLLGSKYISMIKVSKKN